MVFRAIGTALILGLSLTACAEKIFTWKEQVLLHDGSKIIVQRTQSYGGNHEIGQAIPVAVHTIKFTLPNSDEKLSWTSEYGSELGRTNFNLLALHILYGVPYLVVEPNLCLSYNKWGRPNPPYVIFTRKDKAWQRIPLAEVPAELKSINLIVNNGREKEIAEVESRLGYVPIESVQKINSRLEEPEYRTILREAVPNAGGSRCGEMIRYGNGGWLGLDWFSDQPTYAACIKFCEAKGVSAENCPCKNLFKGK